MKPHDKVQDVAQRVARLNEALASNPSTSGNLTPGTSYGGGPGANAGDQCLHEARGRTNQGLVDADDESNCATTDPWHNFGQPNEESADCIQCNRYQAHHEELPFPGRDRVSILFGE